MENLAQKIKESFIAYISAHDKKPKSVSEFVENEEFCEQEFHEQFTSFQTLESEIWGEMIEKTIEKVQSEDVYNEYSGREKMLSFYFTLIEVLKPHRSFVTFYFRMQNDHDQNGNCKKRLPFNRFSIFKMFREEYIDFTKDVLMEASDTGEVLMRPFISDKYAELIWPQTYFIIKFWVEDKSADFENTDAAIEKSVNLSFDLMGKTPLDSAFDFGKFVIQNRWW